MSFTYKYAPKTLDEVVISSATVRNKMESYIKGGNVQPLILHGYFGAGKTSIADLLPNAIEGKKANVKRLKAIEFNTVYDVAEMFDAPPTFYKLFTIDGQKRNYIVTNEFNFTVKAALAFRDVVDEMQEHTQFIFTTNDLSRIDSGLQDRSICLLVPPATAKDWMPRAKYILQCEGVSMSDAKLYDLMNKQLAVSHSNRKLLEKLEEVVWDVKNPKPNDGGIEAEDFTPVPQAPNLNPLAAMH